MVHVCLAVAGPGDHVDRLAAAVRVGTAGVHVSAAWGAHPQLRGRPPAGTRWADLRLAEQAGVPLGLVAVASSPERVALARALWAMVDVASNNPVVVLLAGDVVVDGGLGGIVPATGVARIVRPAPPVADDGLGPSWPDFRSDGPWAPSCLAFAPGSADVIAAVANGLARGHPSAPDGELIEAACVAVGCPVSTITDGCSIGYQIDDREPRVIDVGRLDREAPWRIAGARPPRRPLSALPAVAGVLDRGLAQLRNTEPERVLVGGIEVDDAVRSLVADGLERAARGDGALPPDPYREPAEFRRWLETPLTSWGADIGRYWERLHRGRPDLMRAFPDPGALDQPGFVTWAGGRWADEGTSLLVGTGAAFMRPTWNDVGRERGIDLVGYLGFDSSIGDVARRVRLALAAADVPFAAHDYVRSGSPRSLDGPQVTNDLAYDTALLVVNADQIGNLRADYGDVLAGRYVIGYWFWEVEQIPPGMHAAIDVVDEIWVASDFVADAFRAATDKPVRTVPIPVPQPDVADLSRSQLGLPDDRFVFLATLDYLTVAERKNPVGAIEAFCAAFPEPTDDGPVLVVKSLNAGLRWEEIELSRLASRGRPDVLHIDRHVTRPEQMAYIRAADCLVSLHRSEGLGLHLMEAMWLGTPTIATRYSGNLLFMTDANSCLVDAGRTAVTRGQGYLPDGAIWADPDLEQAASMMRRMVDDAGLRASLRRAGRATMESQPTLAATGRLIAELCEAAVAAASTSGRRSGSWTQTGGQR